MLDLVVSKPFYLFRDLCQFSVVSQSCWFVSMRDGPCLLVGPTVSEPC